MPYNRWIAIPFILDVGRLRGDILHLIRLHFTTCHIECYGQNIENYENHSEHSNLNFICKTQYSMKVKAPLWSNGSVLDHRSLSLVFESGRVHIWRVFHLWLRFITFGGHSAHLTYHAHKTGRKTSIIIIIIKEKIIYSGNILIPVIYLIFLHCRNRLFNVSIDYH